MTVFSVFSPDPPTTEIDLFVDPPLVFAEAYFRALRLEVAPAIIATFCSLDDLIALKSKAPQWERGWEEHERRQPERLADLPLAEKLIWLEQAHRLAMQLGALQIPRTDDPSLAT